MKTPANLTIKMNLENAAFTSDPGMEAARILRDLADKIGNNGLFGPEKFLLRDLNGNRVGIAKAK